MDRIQRNKSCSLFYKYRKGHGCRAGSSSQLLIHGLGYSQLKIKWISIDICRPSMPLRETFGTRDIDWKPVCKFILGKIKTQLGVVNYLDPFSIHNIRKTSPAVPWRSVNMVSKKNLHETL